MLAGSGRATMRRFQFMTKVMFDTLRAPAHPRLARPWFALLLDGTADAIPAWRRRLEAQRRSHGLRPVDGGCCRRGTGPLL